MLGFKRKEEIIAYGSLIVVVDGRLEVIPIDEESEGKVKAGEMILPVTESKEYFSKDGERFLVFNLSLPAQVEAETIKKIRESEVIKGLFEVPEPKRFMDYLPIIAMTIISALVIFVR